MSRLPRDPGIDRLSNGERSVWVAAALQAQLSYIRENDVAFWCERLRRFEVEDVASLLVRLPPLTKSELRSIPPWDLVPSAARPHIRRCYGTSGTTGKPVSLFWTGDDWRALVFTIARRFDELRPDAAILALNGYHQGHLAGQVYQEVIHDLGGLAIPRHYLADDEASTLEQLRLFGCNTLILAERSGLTKSGKTVEDLLRHDPRFFERCAIRWWIGSSTTFTPEMRSVAMEQGVGAVTNLYGSSEFGMLAVSCQADPTAFHTLLGHAFVEVVDDLGAPVPSGQRGRVVVSLISSLDSQGLRRPRAASQLLRFDNGDEATYLTDPCPCGLTSARLQGIKRREPTASRSPSPYTRPSVRGREQVA